MRNNGQVWSLYLACLLAVASAMSWLSLKTCRLEALREADRTETELARREAELQERVSSALYRMDLKMLPLIAAEAARPQYLYQSFRDVIPPQSPTDESDTQRKNSVRGLSPASPLLVPSSDFVLLHFEIDPENRITSPQFPEADQSAAPITTHHVSSANPEVTFSRISLARQLFDYQTLLQKTVATNAARVADADSNTANGNTPALAYNVPAVENFLNQNNHSKGDPFNSNTGIRIEELRSRADQRINFGLTQRRNSTQEVTQANLLNNGMVLENTALQWPAEPETFFPMQPIWLGTNLLMARRAGRDDRPVVQCCWLDWERIRQDLQGEVAELLPDVQFEAVKPDTELKIGTALTTIPVQLIVDRPKMLALLAFDSPGITTKSAFPMPLFAAWSCLGLAAIASALLLRGVIRLSERRAAFVSAVTHELRTPLTTFRMYSEMLAHGMVPPEKQQQYAITLRAQADRLSLLVENVLQFARLERGPAKIPNEMVTVQDLLDRFRSRLEERATDGQMQLVFEVDEAAAKLSLVTQPAAIEQTLFNLVDNACKYAQMSTDRRIVIAVCQTSNGVQFRVRDFGPGIKPSDRKRIFEPFQQSATATAHAIHGVGLGLSLCHRMARSLGGRLTEQPCPTGAMFVLEIPSTSPVQPLDMPP